MQKYFGINKNSRFVDIANFVGDRNVSDILSANGLARSANVGSQFAKMCNDIISSVTEPISWQRKSSILNKLTESSDVFENAALLNESGWKVLSELGTFPGMLMVPETINIPDGSNVLGNGKPVGRTVYDKVMNSLETPPHFVEPAIFNEYSAARNNSIIEYSTGDSAANPWQMFHIPWGDVTLYSSLSGDSIDVPAYPEEMSDGRKANYTTMPDLLFNYEPWYLYQSSGPRTNQYKWDLHRDMWSGDHSDGKANELIRFCEAMCYPRFQGSTVQTGTCTLYVKGKSLITGIVEDVSVNWDGPILQDGWYGHFTLEVTITEISDQALSYDTVRSMPLIGN